jgi:hypothetical protein
MQTQRAYANVVPTRTDNTPMPTYQRQCAWCGTLMGGPLDGFLPTTAAGVVAILGGAYIIHDQCDHCHDVYDQVRL